MTDEYAAPPPNYHRNRWIIIWAGMTVILLFTIASLSLALIAKDTASSSAARANTTANCVNDALGDRNALTSTQNQAEIEQALGILSYGQAQLGNVIALSKVAATKPGPEQTKAFNEFVATLKASGVKLEDFVLETNTYVATLQRIEAYRQAHPLGRC